MADILNIAGYKFTFLQNLQVLQASLQAQANACHLKGTLLLSEEGINLSLAGDEESVRHFQQYFRHCPDFSDMIFHEFYSATQPFKKLKVKIKKEIITMGQPNMALQQGRAPAISAEVFKAWLDQKKDMIVLDNRNDYEVQLGRFNHAIDLNLDHFGEFPEACKALPRNKPIVMYCTGGIRCEKASLYMLNQGYSEVYQLDGGILGYFSKVGNSHYQGDCFVFDERSTISPS